MTFFNKKEDVLELKLTPYGRKLLSHGKLEPKYYAFFDDDILYDSAKAGFSETNSESKTRILNNTPSTKVNFVNFGVESNINNNYEKVLDKFMPNPIGTNSQIEKKTSGWELVSLDKEMDSASLTSSLNSEIQNITQINCKLNFTMSIDNLNTYDGDLFELANSYNLLEQEDGDFIKLEKETALFYIMEKNGFVNNDSFEVEVFIKEQGGSKYKKLKFKKPDNEIINDMLVMKTPGELGDTVDFKIDNTEYVEHYVELSVDKNIPDEDICKGLEKIKDSNLYLDLDLKCPERVDQMINIYTSTVGDIEECD